MSFGDSELQGKVVLVTGANGFLGKHVCVRLEQKGAVVVRNTIDMTNLENGEWPDKPDLVMHLAAKVKGIGPNRAFPYTFFEQNTLMTLTLMQWLMAWRDVPVVAAGSVCAYPEEAAIPFNERNFWDGKPDHNNLGYGYAKRFLSAALECAAKESGLRYVHLISANLYGPGDHFDDSDGHVIPSLIKRMDEVVRDGGTEFVVWGSGRATRDFLYVEDAARAYVAAAEYLLSHKPNLEVNIGSHSEISIAYLAYALAGIMDYRGEIVFDTSKPDGQMRRKIDTNKADVILEWCNITSLRAGLTKTVEWYRETKAESVP